MDGIADAVLGLSGSLALAVIFLAAYLESALLLGMVVPGETMVMAGGVLALHDRVPLWSVMVVACLATILGDSTGYAVGRKFGEPLLKKLPDRLIKPKTIDRAKLLMEDAGGKAVMGGRFTPALNVVIPPLAGMSKMPYAKFLAWNIPSAIAWGVGYAALGYAAGAGYRTIADKVGWAGLAVTAVVLAGIWWWVKKRAGKRLDARLEQQKRGGRAADGGSGAGGDDATQKAATARAR